MHQKIPTEQKENYDISILFLYNCSKGNSPITLAEFPFKNEKELVIF